MPSLNELYCNKCGKKLIEGKCDIVGYTRRGKAVHKQILKCPKKRWWNSHDLLVFYSNPDEVKESGELIAPGWVQDERRA